MVLAGIANHNTSGISSKYVGTDVEIPINPSMWSSVLCEKVHVWSYCVCVVCRNFFFMA